MGLSARTTCHGKPASRDMYLALPPAPSTCQFWPVPSCAPVGRARAQARARARQKVGQGHTPRAFSLHKALPRVTCATRRSVCDGKVRYAMAVVQIRSGARGRSLHEPWVWFMLISQAKLERKPENVLRIFGWKSCRKPVLFNERIVTNIFRLAPKAAAHEVDIYPHKLPVVRPI